MRAQMRHNKGKNTSYSISTKTKWISVINISTSIKKALFIDAEKWILPKVLKNWKRLFLAGIYLFKVNNGNPRTMLENCSKLKIKTSERHNGYLSSVFIVNFE